MLLGRGTLRVLKLQLLTRHRLYRDHSISSAISRAEMHSSVSGCCISFGTRLRTSVLLCRAMCRRRCWASAGRAYRMTSRCGLHSTQHVQLAHCCNPGITMPGECKTPRLFHNSEQHQAPDEIEVAAFLLVYPRQPLDTRFVSQSVSV